MKSKNVLQVFEYQKIKIGEQSGGVKFKANHLRALAKYNESHKNKYFTLIYQGIQFKQYVGVIQVGELTIEILPKADRDNKPDKSKWHGVLLDMLKVCKYLKTESISNARLKLKSSNLLDIYIEHFLFETEKIVRKGLVKKYTKRQSNQNSLKGSLQFQKHFTANLVHKERFFVEHQVYDTEHLLHQILNEALLIIPNISRNPNFIDRIKRLQLLFPELARLKISDIHFEKIRLNRKTEHYQFAFAIARMLLLNYSPDVMSGRQNVIALLFNMNGLFEEYVFQKLKRVEELDVHRQQSKEFWEDRKVRPDIVVFKDEITYVLDTKWKVLPKAVPSDSDLKQMYVYNQYWNSPKTILIYPQVYGFPTKVGHFKHASNSENISMGCDLVFVDILDESGRLNGGLGEDIFECLNYEN